MLAGTWAALFPTQAGTPAFLYAGTNAAVVSARALQAAAGAWMSPGQSASQHGLSLPSSPQPGAGL